MRLRWGPHRDRSPEQVLLRDPLYVIEVLDRRPEGGLAAIFRDLVDDFDARPLATPCARCGGAATDLCAYPASTDLIGYCRGCVLVSPGTLPEAALRIGGYEDALRHVTASFRRGLRFEMRRIIAQLCRAKGGPTIATEISSQEFLHGPWARPASDRLPFASAAARTGGPAPRTFMSAPRRA